MVGGLRASWGLLPASVAGWACVTIAANLLEAPELALAIALGLALACLTCREQERPPRPVDRPGRPGRVPGAGRAQRRPRHRRLGHPGRRRVGGPLGRSRGSRAGTAFIVVIVAALVAAGQDLSNFASYLHGALAVAIGYGSAMGLSSGRGAEDWYAALDLALAVLVFTLALRGSPPRHQVAAVLMLALWIWETLKEGFVRHDMHDLIFFGLFVVALGLARLPRRLVPVQTASIALAALLTCLANGAVPPSLRSPVEDVRSIYHEVADVASGARWAEVQAMARYQVRVTGDALHPAVVEALAGLTVAAEPWEDALSFAYPQLRWRPEPVLQSYSAYTSYLDHLDASFLASPRAPERILYQSVALDGRDPFWDPPTTMVATYCHYRQLSVSGPWQVLGLVPDRCGEGHVVGQARARFGQPVDVPVARRPRLGFVLAELTRPGPGRRPCAPTAGGAGDHLGRPRHRWRHRLPLRPRDRR